MWVAMVRTSAAADGPSSHSDPVPNGTKVKPAGVSALRSRSGGCGALARGGACPPKTPVTSSHTMQPASTRKSHLYLITK
jgi:hypothetical protein